MLHLIEKWTRVKFERSACGKGGREGGNSPMIQFRIGFYDIVHSREQADVHLHAGVLTPGGDGLEPDAERVIWVGELQPHVIFGGRRAWAAGGHKHAFFNKRQDVIPLRHQWILLESETK